jgi:hypothetical protein
VISFVAIHRVLSMPVRLRGREWNPWRYDTWYWGSSDPRFRRGISLAFFLQVLLLLLITLLAGVRGCIGMQEPYNLPKGSGVEVVAQRVIVKKVQRTPRKKLMVKAIGSVILYVPQIDDSKVLERVQEETLNTYQASAGKAGKLGKGGGTKGGWPNGVENAAIRFIRLQYEGGDWDQDMGVDADNNFLREFANLTGLKVAEQTEAVPVAALKHFPKHRAPPFVFITGKGGISLTTSDFKTLRWYCTEEGGLIFADNGGGTFDHAFRAAMAQTFPELQWVDIPSDDVLFQQPFLFPSGAPPLWHHSGSRALGLKHNGRWIVFYHQGDINDAWKTGHSGASPGLAAEAYKLGVNVINYAVNNYWSQHYN